MSTITNHSVSALEMRNGEDYRPLTLLLGGYVSANGGKRAYSIRSTLRRSRTLLALALVTSLEF